MKTRDDGSDGQLVPDDWSLESLIAAEAGRLGLNLEASAGEALARFAALFLKWNAHINLAAVDGPRELVERHFVDAFAASRFVPVATRVVDVGTGGGLPVLPLALVREDLVFDCFEPIQKKGAFLRTAVREMNLRSRVSIHAESVESPVKPPRAQSFDVAMSRATLEPAAWLALGTELVRRPTGRVIVFATLQSEVGLPSADDSLAYGRNRRLLSYTASR